MRRPSVLLALTALAVAACGRKATPSGSPASSSPPVSTAAVGDATTDARDTAAAIRRAHPLACRAAMANNAWAECHDEAKGFERALACAKDARTRSRDAVAALPAASASSSCGRDVERACRAVAEGNTKFFDALVPWLEGRRVPLQRMLQTKSLQDACPGSAVCEGMPSGVTTPEASYAQVMAVECTKPLFQCGRARDNVCWINKVAARLGAACDPEENKPSDPLLVRATGLPIR